MLVAKSIGAEKPNTAVIVPINIKGIIAKENIGKKIKFPIKLYVGNMPKCIATNGAVNMVAITEVNTAMYRILRILFGGILGFMHEYNHTSPNTAEKDN
jgi:hypothetical protein